MILHYGDLIDGNCLVKIINTTKPTEIYNLGAQSHVKVSYLIYLSDFQRFIFDIFHRFLSTLLSTRLRWTVLELSDCSTPSVLVGYQKVFVFTKHLPQNCMGKYKKCHRKRPHLFIPEVLMELQSFLLTGKFGASSEFLFLK